MRTERAATSKGPGLYFNATTSEILRVDDAVVDPGQSWKKFSEDYRLGLLAARRELERQGLVKDASGIEWSGLSAGSRMEGAALSEFIARFKRDSEDASRRASNKSFLFHRLTERVASIVQGSTVDAGHSGSLVPIPVTAKQAKNPRNRSDIGTGR